MQTRPLFLCLTAAAILTVSLIACQPGKETSTGEPASPDMPVSEGSPAGTPLDGSPVEPSPDSIQSLWAASPHGNSYELDDAGTNSTCARCHAPVNYVPSMDDMPESCAACKFEVEPPPPLIAETDWVNVSCNVCHQVRRGEVDPEYAWLSIPPIEEYEELATTTELCVKCHTPVNVLDHYGIEVAGDHAGYTCTQCHDPHSTIASCSTSVCHPEVADPAAPIAGHDAAHAAVTCVACHDASGLDVRPDDEGGWFTYQPGSLIPAASHNIVRQALCERCHYSNNPWNLSPEVSSTAP